MTISKGIGRGCGGGRRTIYTPEIDARIRSLALEGWSARQVGDQLGLTRNQVIGRATRMRPQVQWTLTSFGNNAAAVIRKRGGGRTGRPRQHRRKRINLPDAVMVERTPPPNDAPPSLGLSILEVKDGVCRYPYGERFPYTFCGHPTDKGDVYCPFHQALTCTPVRPLPVVWIKHAEAT